MGAGVAWGVRNATTGVNGAAMHSSITPHITSGRFPSIRTTATDAEVGLSASMCSNHAAPDFQPTGVATLAGGQIAPIQPPNDGFFEPVTFIGAVPPAPAANWMAGWTSFEQR